MIVKFRSKLTYANVMATIAVFVALGGSSYAAIKVTGKSVKDRSLTAKDIKKSSLTGDEIKDRSLFSRDFALGQLPQGAKGDKGDKGDTGQQGPFPSVLPPGKTIRGHYGVRELGLASFSASHDGISYGFLFASAPTKHYIPKEQTTPPPECPGTPDMPEAAPGHLCVFEKDRFPTGGAGTVNVSVEYVDRFGALVSADCACGQVQTLGTWAATSP